MDDSMYFVDTDASDHGIGAVLSHRYCVTRKELLAVVHFLKYFRQYLFGVEFLVRTDHAALQCLRKTPHPIGQQGRWLEILEEFNFTVAHRAGRLHTNADAMSRKPCRQCGSAWGQHKMH